MRYLDLISSQAECNFDKNINLNQVGGQKSSCVTRGDGVWVKHVSGVTMGEGSEKSKFSVRSRGVIILRPLIIGNLSLKALSASGTVVATVGGLLITRVEDVTRYDDLQSLAAKTNDIQWPTGSLTQDWDHHCVVIISIVINFMH